MDCSFIQELSKLRKSSAEAVENIDSFSPFKQYLHVVRPVEVKLKALLRKVNEQETKSLVLLCGSAGDGKSHLLSYLKNADSENLLEGYLLHNDATESDKPEMTSVETLAERLKAFSDEQIDHPGSCKMIVAINLGTLNNFIESEHKNLYSRLCKYVQDNEILTNATKESEYKDNSAFQHISFSDYQMFSLNSVGVETSYLQSIFEKVFSDSSENPFFISHQACNQCILKTKCPINHNYVFLQNKTVQNSVIYRIIETIIKDKMIVSTRDVFSFIYDILVHPDFDPNTYLNASINSVEAITGLAAASPLKAMGSMQAVMRSFRKT